MVDGVVKWYDAARGYGFVTRSDGVDVFIGSAQVREANIPVPVQGMRLRFLVEMNRSGKTFASNIEVLSVPAGGAI
jgi:cold shock CspA family protein